jgi:hypothetical protein
MYSLALVGKRVWRLEGRFACRNWLKLIAPDLVDRIVARSVKFRQ